MGKCQIFAPLPVTPPLRAANLSAAMHVIRFVPKRAILFSPPPPRCKSVKASSFLPTFLDGASPLLSFTRRRPPATLKFKSGPPRRINSECDFYTLDFLSTFSTDGGFVGHTNQLGMGYVVQYQYKYWVQRND